MTRKFVALGIVALVIALIYIFDLHHYLSFATLKDRLGELQALFDRQPVLFVVVFMGIHIVALALSLPGAVLSFALAGGAIFGLVAGTAIVLLSLTLGDSLGFLVARYILRDWVRRRFGKYSEAFDRGIARDGAFYLLSLRLMAVVPYFVVNFAMALTRMPLKVFAPVSFIGLVPATALYVAAGAQLAQIEKPSDVLSLPLVLSFVALGLLPIAARLVFRKRFSAPVP